MSAAIKDRGGMGVGSVRACGCYAYVLSPERENCRNKLHEDLDPPKEAPMGPAPTPLDRQSVVLGYLSRAARIALAKSSYLYGLRRSGNASLGASSGASAI